MLVATLLACADPGPEGLDPGFEVALTEGWICRTSTPFEDDITPLVYHAVDDEEQVHLEAWMGAREVTFPDEWATLEVLTGENLVFDQSANKCDDLVYPGGGQVREASYQPVEGTVRLVQHGDEVALELEGLVLRAGDREGLPVQPGWEELPDVVVESATLPYFEL